MIIMFQVGHFQRLLLLPPATGHIRLLHMILQHLCTNIIVTVSFIRQQRVDDTSRNNKCYATLLEVSHVFSIDNID